MTIDEVTDELYGLPPGDFVARRTALARAAKAAGDRGLAQQITSLRRPTQVAWAINQWVRTDPDGVTALLDLAADLLAAQRRSSADRLRELAGRRQALIAECVASIQRDTRDQGVTLSDNAIREVGQSLRAAVADDEVAELLRRGSLVTAAEYSGFGPAGVFLVPDAADEPGADRADRTAPDAAKSASATAEAEDLRRARQALAEAEEIERSATAAVTERDEEVAAARAHVDNLTAERDRLRAELEQRDDELRFAVRQVDAAEEQSRLATASLDSARDALAAARNELARCETDS
ncbi:MULTISPECIES: hypothetical protein [Gordonia]|uniref:Transposase n=1 Tax=Gordonia tangerina TaxID=2911060 RepID=A0ABS9DK26_9ACTN|nr:hypothetical protein [Gordonia tangerina]MCF3939433.1 hypothetical protein [Gordonia tangerina]